MKALILLSLLVTNPSFADLFRADQHCVAWTSKVRLLLFVAMDTIGMNCDIKSEFIATDSGIAFHGQADNQQFKSDFEALDVVFWDTLGGTDGQVDFQSTAAPYELWAQILKLGRGVIPGTLTVNGKKSKVEMPIAIHESGDIVIITGRLNTHLTDLGAKVLSFFWKLLVYIDDSIEIHYRIRLDKTKGSDLVLKPQGHGGQGKLSHKSPPKSISAANTPSSKEQGVEKANRLKEDSGGTQPK